MPFVRIFRGVTPVEKLLKRPGQTLLTPSGSILRIGWQVVKKSEFLKV